MARRDLSSEERKALLQDLVGLRADDDDATNQDPKWFLPLGSHARALRMETLIVRGGRGAGKTALFHFLGHLSGLEAPLPGWPVLPEGVTWVAGFDRGPQHPSEEVIGRFAQEHASDEEQLRLFWYGWLCLRLAKQLKRSLPVLSLSKLATTEMPKPVHIASAAGEGLSELSGWLDALEAELAGKRQSVVVTYDRLDRIKGTGRAGSQMTTSLLALWLAFADRYRQVRPKVFVREDLFQSALSAFPDASKLEARSVSIEWRVEDIYRVLLKHMGNLSDPLREWISTGAKRVDFESAGALGWTPPQSFPETGSPSQKEFVIHLVGEKIGSGQKKGYTHRWIPNHLQDAHGNIVPRSVLNLIRNAAEVAINQGAGARGTRLLTPSELQGALEKTSKRRVDELKEEFPVVLRLENLRGKEVMMSRREAVKALCRTSNVLDEFENDGESALRRLIEIGVTKERGDGRIDVADIYRDGFGILRRGGIKRAR